PSNPHPHKGVRSLLSDHLPERGDPFVLLPNTRFISGRSKPSCSNRFEKLHTRATQPAQIHIRRPIRAKTGQMTPRVNLRHVPITTNAPPPPICDLWLQGLGSHNRR